MGIIFQNHYLIANQDGLQVRWMPADTRILSVSVDSQPSSYSRTIKVSTCHPADSTSPIQGVAFAVFPEFHMSSSGDLKIEEYVFVGSVEFCQTPIEGNNYQPMDLYHVFMVIAKEPVLVKVEIPEERTIRTISFDD